MIVQTSHSLSVDCVVFGFNGKNLKVLLVERRYRSIMPDRPKEYKLPGSMILEAEALPDAANRVLAEMTGLRNVFLKQTTIFSDPQRVAGEELQWINEYHGIKTNRVVTVGYYALVKLDHDTITHTTAVGAHWASVDDVKHLAMDHKDILSDALTILCEHIASSPIAFDLLPRKFTVRQLQTLYEAVLGIDIDNRNFRKKILESGYLTPTGEREKGVAHKPAEFYIFNMAAYKKSKGGKFKLSFI
ncbi:MAG: NUDIX domain-containing protein [Rikenellaceae bacterium]